MKLIGPFKQLLTMDFLPAKGALSDAQLEVIPDAGILQHDGKILQVGDFRQLQIQFSSAEIERLEGDYVALPGMIDVHTHICWAGSRAKDYALRLAGKSYLEIAAAGGGIWDTVLKTRAATEDELVALTVERANELLKQGITTVEVKSGYGLSVEHELKMLEAIKLANQLTKNDLVATCLATHIVPKEFEGDEKLYLQLLVNELLPEVKKRGLANRVDIFVEKNAFSVEMAKPYLLSAKELGFDIVLHGDQFSTGGAQLATEVDALSIDHLEAANKAEIEVLAQSNVIPVVLPGASLGLGEPFAPARKLLDAGTSMVIASDWNPGSAPMGNLLVQAALLGAAQKLSMTEVLAALTCRAALALKKLDRGVLKKSNIADIIAFKTANYQDILYRQGQLQPTKIWKAGEKIIDTEN